MKLAGGDWTLDLSVPRVMGILNVTPDSFSDGGKFVTVDHAVGRARTMVAEGAAIIDVGGESTRPGAEPVSVQDELVRILPVIEALVADIDVPVSVDTTKPAVMRAAVRAGASIINDINALRAPEALQVAAETGAAICLMHMQGEPRTMQAHPVYSDVVGEVRDFLGQRVKAALDSGVPAECLMIDPGFGFGKTLEHNMALLAELERFAEDGWPLVVGVSRKSMIGQLLGGVPVEGRVQGSVAAAVIATMKGARVLRVHDVKPTVEALRVAAAVIEAGEFHR